jgi:hypothetical protein
MKSCEKVPPSDFQDISRFMQNTCADHFLSGHSRRLDFGWMQIETGVIPL